MKPTGELRQWHCHDIGKYTIIWGSIFDDQKGRWPDGLRIHTSAIKEIQEYEHYYLVFTLNSIYKCNKKDELHLGTSRLSTRPKRMG